MPMTLVTGLPGHGKTLYTLSRWKDEAEKAKRPVFYHGIKGVKIPGWQQWDPKDWQNLPAGALMIIDEAWEVFPVRGRGEPPDWIGQLAKHRHLGLDFVMITQDPMLMDVFVRRLIDRHFHVVRKFGTHSATIHEFPNGVREQISKSRDGSIRHEWRYPKATFDLYESAELHTVKRRIPMRVYMLFALPVILAGLIWVIYERMKPENVQKRMDESAGIQRKPGPGNGTGGTAANASPGPMTPAQYAEQYSPRVPDLPHTAPIYDEVTKPTQAPYPAACIASKTVCKCYTQQATRLQVSDDLCRQIADGGFFLAWAQQAVQAVPLSGKDSQAKSLHREALNSATR